MKGGGRGNLKPNTNCNLSSWVNGCEPGWACSVGDNSVDLDLNKMPHRILECEPCCEGFFCPRGLTCMIPCPLGAFCPLSTLNSETGTIINLLQGRQIIVAVEQKFGLMFGVLLKFFVHQDITVQLLH
ncbi:hypothetical protein BC332_29208 [Capsicum chinense]|nr:hypothetical protein BC332_29208 [Capsicum chinense]